MFFLDFFNDFLSDLVNDSTFWCMVILHGPHSVTPTEGPMNHEI